MTSGIEHVAVVGGGTMGGDIAAACAAAGCDVLILDVDQAALDRCLARLTSGRSPAIEDEATRARIRTATLDEGLDGLAGYDWVCEAAPEDLELKRRLFERLLPHLGEDAVVSTNTSGIPLRAIADGQPEHALRRLAVTHFFNPVKVMKLVEVVPAAEADPAVIERLSGFLTGRLGKGVVRAKDTVNFIGNRIGCFWMLSGLHKAKPALAGGLDMETIDALMGEPVGLPSTGLFGLIDLIGLDVMASVGENLETNLPEADPGRAFVRLPAAEARMLERGQNGRKAGGGFYRIKDGGDGDRLRETFDLTTEAWRPAQEPAPPSARLRIEDLFAGDDASSRFVQDLMGGTLAYAADLVPTIADDIVNVDRAMRWGFNWAAGPFEMLDRVGARAFGDRWSRASGRRPHMLAVLEQAGAETFYRRDGREHLGPDGRWRTLGD